MKKSVAFALALTFALNIHAQVNDQKYDDHLKEVSAEIWNDSNKAFKVTTIPAEFGNESAVIIAKSFKVTNTAKKVVSFNFMGGGASGNVINYDNTLHLRVKINDKASLEDFSTISYTRRYTANNYNQKVTYVGAKILKANGSEVVVNTGEAVLTKDEKNQKESKLAISDLQVGDILDYFIKEEIVTSTGGRIQGPYTYFLGGEYPIMEFKLHMELNERAGGIYVNANGAPEPKISDGDNFGANIDLSLKNIPKYNTSMWTYPMRQVPYVSIEYRVLTDRTQDLNSDFDRGKVLRNKKPEKIFELLKREYQAVFRSRLNPPDYWDKAKDFFGGKKEMRDAPVDSVVKTLYAFMLNQTALNTIKAAEWDIESMKARFEDAASVFDFSIALAKSEIPHEFLYVTPRYGPKSTDIMPAGELIPIIHLKGSKDIWVGFDRIEFFSNKIPSWIEGEEARGFTVDDGWDDVKFKMPVSTEADNVHTDEMEMSLKPGSLQTVVINRGTKLTGNYIESSINSLKTLDGYMYALYASINKNASIEEDMKDARAKKEQITSMPAGFSNAKKAQQKSFEADIKDWYDQSLAELTSYNVTSQTAKQFAYTTSFTMDNWVKKAGNNYIVDAGKVVGSFKKVEEKERTRTLDIYMPFARTLDFKTTFVIPEGYTAKGIENFNKQIVNETGQFISTAVLSGNKIIMTVKRVYNKNNEPAANWPKLLELIDAAYDYTQQKLLLEKAK